MNPSLIELFATALAGVASLTGLVLALSQFTASAKLKSQAARWREEIVGAENAYDKDMFVSLHRDAIAGSIALKYVPSAALLLPYLTVLFSLGMFVWAGVATGQADPAKISLTAAQEATDGAIFILPPVIILILTLASNSITHIFRLRRSIEADYLEGESLRLLSGGWRIADSLFPLIPVNPLFRLSLLIEDADTRKEVFGDGKKSWWLVPGQSLMYLFLPERSSIKDLLWSGGFATAGGILAFNISYTISIGLAEQESTAPTWPLIAGLAFTGVVLGLFFSGTRVKTMRQRQEIPRPLAAVAAKRIA